MITTGKGAELVAGGQENQALRLQPGAGQRDLAHMAGPRAERAEVVRREPGRQAGRRRVARVARGGRDEDRARPEVAVDPVGGVTVAVGREQLPVPCYPRRVVHRLGQVQHAQPYRSVVRLHVDLLPVGLAGQLEVAREPGAPRGTAKLESGSTSASFTRVPRPGPMLATVAMWFALRA